MTDERWLLDRVAEAFESRDPVPDGAVSAAIRAGTLVGPRHRLAAVGPAGGLRGPVVGPVLSFVAGRPAGRVDLELAAADRTVIMTGVVAGGAALVVRWPGGERVIATDETGRFSATGLPPGPLGVALRWAGTEAVGPWFVA